MFGSSCFQPSEFGRTVVRILLDAGADVHARHICDWKALIMAAEKGKTEVVQLLIQAGSDVNARNKWGHTALMKAKIFGHTQIVEMLRKAGAAE